jgi:peptidoglycan-associated lipoprotein
MRLLPVLLIVVLSLGLGGCPKKPTTVPDAGADTTAPRDGDTSSGSGGQVGVGQDLPGAAGIGAEGAAPAGLENVIYFDFDQSEIRPEYAALITGHAKHLAAAGSTRVRLEGHTDERGSREYNIALAERRAQAVRRALMLQGASEGQLTTVSYGEERPATEGADDAASEKNRRVEIVYGR